MVHRVTIVGFVGQDPEMRYAPNSKNWELTSWFRITAWRKLAETATPTWSRGPRCS